MAMLSTDLEYCKFGKDCVSFLAFSLGRKIKIRND